MAYKNGKDVLPKDLFELVQQHYSGGLIYIPELSNTKEQLKIRNTEIKKKKQQGYSIEELMEEYYLSYDSIKRIVYRK